MTESTYTYYGTGMAVTSYGLGLSAQQEADVRRIVREELARALGSRGRSPESERETRRASRGDA